MVKKSSAHYQREFRKRLREQGFVKKEVWIKPGNTKVLADIEKVLRADDVSQQDIGGLMKMNENGKTWSTEELFSALLDDAVVKLSKVSLELIEGVDSSIVATMHEYGDLPVFMSVSGQQIVAESVLWSVDDVKDVAEFNKCVLLTHKYFPLSTISLEKSENSSTYYNMFGALSSTSSVENVVLELETLADNVINATDAFQSFLK